MIVVHEVLPNVFERISGDPAIDSLDGELRASLQTILSDTWTAEDRARFGVHIVEPFAVPVGKQCVGEPSYTWQDEVVVEVYLVENEVTAPILPNPLAGRVTTIEGAQ